MKMLTLAVVMALVVGAVAPLASADMMPANSHYLTRQYVLVGLAGNADYKFVLVGEKQRRSSEAEFDARVLTEGETFESYRSHWRYSLRQTLVAVKGELPEQLTAEWFKNADAIRLDVSSLMRGSGTVDNSNPAYKTRITYRVSIVGPESDASDAFSLRLTKSAEVSFDQEGNEIRESDGDGFPSDETRVPRSHVPAVVLVALAAFAAGGLLIGSRVATVRR